jgi:hypothetical protein
VPGRDLACPLFIYGARILDRIGYRLQEPNRLLWRERACNLVEELTGGLL